MKALVIARREFRALVRERHLWVVALAMTVFVTVAWTPPTAAERAALGPAVAVGSFQTPVFLYGGIAASLLTYRAIVGDRETGRLKLLLGLSASRADVTLGKHVGRTGALLVMFVVPVFAGAVIGFVRLGDVAVGTLLAFGLAAALYLAAIAGVGIGASTVMDTSVRAAGLTFGAYAAFFAFWDTIVRTVYVTMLGGAPDSVGYFVASRISPVNAFQALTNMTLGVGSSAGPYRAIYRVTEEGMRTNLHVAATALDTVPPILQGSVSTLALLGWAVLPPLLAHVGTVRRDL